MTMNRTFRPARWAWAFLLLAGCGSSLPLESDRNQARTILTGALDAWKQGTRPDASAKVRVNDREWTDGSTLEAYELQGDGQKLGLNVQQTVALQLKTPAGKSVKKTVNYVVTTGSYPLVMRQDIDE